MNDKLFSALADFSEAEAKAVAEYETKNNEWWNGLTEEEREDAFYAVCKRIYEARVVEDCSYRGTLYGKFGFAPHTYRLGMECGFFTMHNMLHEAREYEAMQAVTCFKLVDEEGRKYENHLEPNQYIRYSLQDNGKTLKVFIGNSLVDV